MSYYYKNKIYDEYVIDAVIYPSQGDIVYDTIEIFNNEQLRIDFSNIDYRCSDPTIRNQQLSKIVVDWGDGKIDRLSKSLMTKSSTIGTYDPISWKQATHLFNVDKRYQYATTDISVLPKITITLYNTFNDKVKIFIPYMIVYKSIYDIGTHFSMLDANVTNSNLTSYVLKENKDDTIVIATTRDWKKIYGTESEIVTVKDTTISSNYADQFVNEDSIVWDWKSVPEVYLTINETTHTSSGKNIQYFDCNFDEVTVNLDSWIPKCYRYIKSEDQQGNIIYGKENIVITSDNIWTENRHYKIFYKDGKEIKSLKNGVYENYLDVVGINDIEGQSSKIYKSIPQLTNEDIHPCCLQEKNGFIPSETVTTKQFKLQYSLGQYGVPYHYDITPQMITDAKIYIKPNSITLQNVDGVISADQAIVFEYPIDLYKNQLIIQSKSIPDGNYSAFVHVEDVLGYSTSNIYQSGKVFEVGTFDINYSNFGEVTNLTITNNEDQHNLVFNWRVDNYTQLDTIKLSVLNTETKDYLINSKVSYDRFNHEIDQNGISFNMKKTLEEVPDGIYDIEVQHILNMTSFGGERYKSLSLNEYTFKYPRPIINVDKVIPYLKYDITDKVTPFKEYIYIVGSEQNNQNLNNIRFYWKEYKMDLNEEMKTKQSGIISDTLSVDIPLNTILYPQGVRFDFKAYKSVDEKYKRQNDVFQTPSTDTSVVFRRNVYDNECEKMFEHSSTEENILTSAEKYYSDEQQGKVFTSRDIHISSLVDVNKSHVLIDDDGTKYYFYTKNNDNPKPLSYTWKGQDKPIVFGTKTFYKIQDDAKVFFDRFYGDKFEIKNITNISKLPSVKQFFNDDNNKPIFNITKYYDKSSDMGKFSIDWSNDVVDLLNYTINNRQFKEYANCIYGVIQFMDYNTNEIKHTFNIKSSSSKLLLNPDDIKEDITSFLNIGQTPLLKLGVYKIRLKYASFNTHSDDNVLQFDASQFSDLNLYLEEDEILTVNDPFITPLKGDNGYFRCSFRWLLHHSKGSNLVLHVKYKDNVTQYNVNEYSYYEPYTTYQENEIIEFWFTYNSSVVNWTTLEKTFGRTKFKVTDGIIEMLPITQTT